MTEATAFECETTWRVEPMLRSLHQGAPHQCTRQAEHEGVHLCDCGRMLTNTKEAKQ